VQTGIGLWPASRVDSPVFRIARRRLGSAKLSPPHKLGAKMRHHGLPRSTVGPSHIADDGQKSQVFIGGLKYTRKSAVPANGARKAQSLSAPSGLRCMTVVEFLRTTDGGVTGGTATPHTAVLAAYRLEPHLSRKFPDNSHVGRHCSAPSLYRLIFSKPEEDRPRRSPLL
jgi:hypothetical protein